MKKWAILVVLGCTAVFGAAAGGGRHDSEKVRIGISKIVSHPLLDACEQGIKDQLSDRGINAVLYSQNAGGDLSAAREIAQKFKKARLSLTIGISTPSSSALARTIRDVPVVFSAVTNPVEAKLVSNWSRRNITGVSDALPVTEQIKMYREISGFSTLGFIYTEWEENSISVLALVEKVCAEEGIALVSRPIHAASDLRQAAIAIVGQVDGIYIPPDSTIAADILDITSTFSSAKKPVFSSGITNPDGGGCLATWGFNYYKVGRITGDIAADILQGKKPADIPTKYLSIPEDMDLMLDLDNAKMLGITIPQKYLDMADMFFENGRLTERR